MNTLLLLLLLLLVSTKAEATTWWVSVSGNDANTCTQAQSASTPKRTITAGLACVGSGGGTAGAGHTVMVGDGTYNEQLLDKIPGGTAGNPFTLKSVNQWGASLAPTAATMPTIHEAIYQTVATSYVVIDGLDLNGQPSHDGDASDGPSGLIVNSDSITNWIIRNSRFRNWTGDGVGYRGQDWQFINNTFEANGGPDFGAPNFDGALNRSHGVYWGVGQNTIFDGNTFINNVGFGLHMYNGCQTADPKTGACIVTAKNNIIRNNRFFNHNTAGQGMVLAGEGYKVYNNLFYNNTMGGLRLEYGNGAINTEVYENTFYNNGGTGGINVSAYSSGASVKNNITYQNGGAGDIINTGSGTTFSNNFCTNAGTGCAFNGNPQFTNAAAADFTLQAKSPARDISAATLSAPYNVDIVGTPRTAGAFDLGAYEAGGVAPVTVTITTPTSSPTFTTPGNASSVSLAGTATNATAISWTCPRCGVSGSAGGTLTNWTISSIPLLAGENVITVQADPGAITDTIRVTYIPTFPGNTLALASGFETGSGTSTVDSSGNNNTGTFTNGPTWNTAGKFGNSITFDGVDDYVRVLDNPNNSLHFTQSFTLSAWVFPTAPPTGFQAVMTKDWGAGYSQFLFASSSGYCATEGAILAGFTANGTLGPSYTVCSAAVLTPNQWTHLAVTYDGAALTLYINGVAPGGPSTVAASGYIEPSTLPLRIGNSAFGDEGFLGRIDEVRADNWALPVGSATPNAPCAYTDYTTQVRGAASLATIRDDMNCPVVAATPPLIIKIPASATALKVGVTPTTGTIRLGLHVTTDELAIWRIRAVSGPYKSAGDVSTNSPGDWDRIVTTKNTFTSSPAGWHVTGPTGATCVNSTSVTPIADNTALNPRAHLSAAFYALIAADATVAATVKTWLMTQAAETNLNYSNSSKWCIGPGSSINPEHVFDLASWMTTLVFTMDYLQILDPNIFSVGEVTILQNWFLAFANVANGNMQPSLNGLFQNRPGGDYTVITPAFLSGTPYFGAPQFAQVNRIYNNRRGDIMASIAAIGVKFNNATYRDAARIYVQETLRFAVYPAGYISDFLRWEDSPGNEERGLHYAASIVGSAITIADLFARNGDASLYSYTTALGATGSDGGPKGIHFLISFMSSYWDGTYSRYATNNAGEVGDASFLINGRWATGQQYVDDVWWAQANLYYQDAYYKTVYLRTAAGTVGYSASLINPPALSWTGQSATYPGILYMFGQMEGVVNPYVLAGPTLRIGARP